MSEKVTLAENIARARELISERQFGGHEDEFYDSAVIAVCDAAERQLWTSTDVLPATDGVYLCWCDAPPQSMSAQALRYRKGRGWITSWPVRYWRELDRPE